jgi:hypothetical protein
MFDNQSNHPIMELSPSLGIFIDIVLICDNTAFNM